MGNICTKGGEDGRQDKRGGATPNAAFDLAVTPQLLATAGNGMLTLGGTRLDPILAFMQKCRPKHKWFKINMTRQICNDFLLDLPEGAFVVYRDETEEYRLAVRSPTGSYVLFVNFDSGESVYTLLTKPVLNPPIHLHSSSVSSTGRCGT